MKIYKKRLQNLKGYDVLECAELNSGLYFQGTKEYLISRLKNVEKGKDNIEDIETYIQIAIQEAKELKKY